MLKINNHSYCKITFFKPINSTNYKMKKTILVVVAASLVFATVSAKKPKEVAQPVVPVQVLTNGVDSMSYALGLNVGTDFKKNIQNIPGGKCNTDLLVKAFVTAMKGDSALMKPEVATAFFRTYITAAQAKDADAKKAVGEKFLADNKTKPGVVTTESGLQYQIIKQGEGIKPKATDTVVVHYTGTLIDGTKFDSSVDRGEPVTFPLNQVIKGWTEGVQLMSVGSKYKFFVPYTLGYGEQGAGGVIPPYATLIFEVELLKVKPFVEAPAATGAPATPATTKKTSAKAKK
jgi:FKBP-type peptidyl-prolyl cis-trans isomerase